MRKGIAVLVVVAIIAFSGGLSPANSAPGRAPADDEQVHLNIGGVDRMYLLHVPESLPKTGPVPLVLVFHGGGGHAATMPNFTKRQLEDAVKGRTKDLERRKTELVRTREQMRHFAEHDGLTGLWNHRIIVERLRGEVDRCERDGTPLGTHPGRSRLL